MREPGEVFDLIVHTINSSISYLQDIQLPITVIFIGLVVGLKLKYFISSINKNEICLITYSIMYELSALGSFILFEMLPKLKTIYSILIKTERDILRQLQIIFNLNTVTSNFLFISGIITIFIITYNVFRKKEITITKLTLTDYINNLLRFLKNKKTHKFFLFALPASFFFRAILAKNLYLHIDISYITIFFLLFCMYLPTRVLYFLLKKYVIGDNNFSFKQFVIHNTTWSIVLYIIISSFLFTWAWDYFGLMDCISQTWSCIMMSLIMKMDLRSIMICNMNNLPPGLPLDYNNPFPLNDQAYYAINCHLERYGHAYNPPNQILLQGNLKKTIIFPYKPYVTTLLGYATVDLPDVGACKAIYNIGDPSATNLKDMLFDLYKGTRGEAFRKRIKPIAFEVDNHNNWCKGYVLADMYESNWNVSDHGTLYNQRGLQGECTYIKGSLYYESQILNKLYVVVDARMEAQNRLLLTNPNNLRFPIYSTNVYFPTRNRNTNLYLSDF